MTVNSGAFPLTLSANSPVGLSLDFSLNNSIQSDLSDTPAVSVTTVTSSQSGDSGDQEVELTGLVTAIDSSNQSFTIQTGLNGQTDNILTDSNTDFSFENQNCSANDFSCLATGAIVNVEAKMSNGQVTASDVEGVSAPQTQAVTGTVVSVSTTQNQFQVILQDVEDSQDAQTLTLGLPVMVTVQSGATFKVNAGNLSLSTGTNFGRFANLVVGQEVSVSVSGVQTSPSGIRLSANQVTLEMSEISGTVSSPNASQNTFVLTNLPSLFTSNGIKQILVTVESNTQYEDTTGIVALTANQMVSVSGLPMPDTTNTSQPDLFASAVKVRTD